MSVRFVVLMGMEMHERAMSVLVRVRAGERIEDAIRVFLRLLEKRQRQGALVRFCDPNRDGDRGEESEKYPCCRTESDGGGEETCKRISESPSGIAE